MKNKKPSLLDMECFVQKKAQKTISNISKEEESSVDKEQIVPVEENVKISEPVLPKKTEEKVIDLPKPQTTISPINTDMLQAMKLMLSEFAPSKEFLKEIFEIVTQQKTEIINLKNELDKLKSQVESFNIIADQKTEIRQLRTKINELQYNIEKLQMAQFSEKSFNKSSSRNNVSLDENYKSLILKNIVKMRDENGFSSLDVAKLFKKEGFAIFPPYETWDEETVTQIYIFAKKTGID